MLTSENLIGIEWTEYIGGIGIPYAVIFNKTQISIDEVEALIDNGGWEFDDRIIRLRQKQVKYLHNKED